MKTNVKKMMVRRKEPATAARVSALDRDYREWKRNVRYSLAFYSLYAYLPQVVANKNVQQIVEQLVCLPWGHHRTIIDKCKGNREKAMFYVRRTIQNGWSRNSLLNWLSTDLYEREGKGQTNFALTMPSDDCDLARQLVKGHGSEGGRRSHRDRPTERAEGGCSAEVES